MLVHGLKGLFDADPANELSSDFMYTARSYNYTQGILAK